MSTLVGGTGIIGQDIFCSFGNGKYTTFEGTEIVAENCVKARVKDLVVEGKTCMSDVPCDDYTILDYIECTGTQYIDTGFKANTTTTKFVGAFTPTQKVMGALLGSRNGTASGPHACNVFVLGEGKFRVDWANASYSGTEINYVVGTKYEMEITRGRLVINNTTKSYTNSASVDQLGNFLIGTFNNVTTPYADGFVGYIHECKLYSNDVLIRDFIPVKRISDNVVGMYDVVTKTFFTNAGTGEFIASTTVIPNEIKSVAEEEDNTIFIKINDYDVTNINMPIPLRSLPNGVADTIEGNTLVQRVGEVVLENIEDYNIVSQIRDNNRIGILVGNVLDSSTRKPIISDRFSDLSSGGGSVNGAFSYGKRIFLYLGLSTLDEYIEWFKSNPTTIYYSLATPIIHNITVPQLRTIRGTNEITCDNNIKPKLKLKVKVK